MTSNDDIYILLEYCQQFLREKGYTIGNYLFNIDNELKESLSAKLGRSFSLEDLQDMARSYIADGLLERTAIGSDYNDLKLTQEGSTAALSGIKTRSEAALSGFKARKK